MVSGRAGRIGILSAICFYEKKVSFLKHFHFVMDSIFWQLCELKLKVRTEPQAEQDLSNLPEGKLGQLVRALIRQQLHGGISWLQHCVPFCLWTEILMLALKQSIPLAYPSSTWLHPYPESSAGWFSRAEQGLNWLRLWSKLLSPPLHQLQPGTSGSITQWLDISEQRVTTAVRPGPASHASGSRVLWPLTVWLCTSILELT